MYREIRIAVKKIMIFVYMLYNNKKYYMYTMILWILLFLIGVLIYFLRQREGFIGVTDNTPVVALQEYIQQDLDSLEGTDRLIYVIYKSNGDEKTNKIIDDKIKKIKLYDEYVLLRVFPVMNTVYATSVFSKFYISQLDYEGITLLTNNLSNTKRKNDQLTKFINVDTTFYNSIVSIITTNNKIV